jgi:hypothetical protein
MINTDGKIMNVNPNTDDPHVSDVNEISTETQISDDHLLAVAMTINDLVGLFATINVPIGYDNEGDENNEDGGDDEADGDDDDDDDPFTQTQTASLNAYQPVFKPAPLDAISHCQAIDEFDGSPCPMCLDCDTQPDGVVKSPCGHIFHKKCLHEWLLQGDFCPVCRHQL